MKRIVLLILIAAVTQLSLAQVSGNVNYQQQFSYPESNINVATPSNANVLVSAKGLANVKADAYIAIFNVSQQGKTADDVNTQIDARINQALAALKAKGVETYVDMVSFVPVYEYEVEKKVFSRRTNNEVPVGFELKKNIHVKYTNPALLNEMITLLSAAEIYDLVKVDYFSSAMENIKKELMNRAKTVLGDKIKFYQGILGKPDSASRQLVDGFRVMLPPEMYKSYEAYVSSSLTPRKGYVNQAVKPVTLYYNAIVDKEFDFVINPAPLEPSIQVMYEIKLVVNRERELTPKVTTEYMYITPTGDVKKININR